MKKIKRTRLTVNREALRDLTYDPGALARVVGGGSTVVPRCACWPEPPVVSPQD